MPRCQLEKIVSGGQTGVDRAALDVAIFLDIPHGGWCPLGRRAEDGSIPETYLLRETNQRDYAVRTERNIIDSDGTLILFRNRTSGGTDLTRKLALKHRRPLVCIDLEHLGEDDFERVCLWMEEQRINVLNIAGPRESSCQGIGKQAERFLVDVLKLENEN
jgi:hypothetical protein